MGSWVPALPASPTPSSTHPQPHFLCLLQVRWGILCDRLFFLGLTYLLEENK